MDIFALENLQEKIYFPKSREYFQEVISSYNNKNFRSATVMLWSVIVFDLTLKIQHLVDTYNDSNAKNILDEIKRRQSEDSKDSSWEVYLVTEVCQKTELIDSFELTNLLYLQKQRHLSAHPVIKDTTELYIPIQVTVRSLIRNALDSVLIKSPIYTQKIFDELRKDLSTNRDILNSRKTVKQYVERKYLSRLSELGKEKIFKKFWKFVFRLETNEIKKDRIVFSKFLRIMYENDEKSVEAIILKEQDYYNNIGSSNAIMIALLMFLNEYPSIYSCISESEKLKLNNFINEYKGGKPHFLAHFVFDDIFEYLQNVEHEILNNTDYDIELPQWKRMYKKHDSIEFNKRFHELINIYYSKSSSFDVANTRFDILKNFIIHYDIEDIKHFIENAENNNQTYGRGLASEEYYEVKTIINDKFSDFDFVKYPNFLKVANRFNPSEESVSMD